MRLLFLLPLMIIAIPTVYGFSSTDMANIILGNETNKAILRYCVQNPNGDITRDLINTGQIGINSLGYTCQKAFADNPKVVEALEEYLNALNRLKDPSDLFDNDALK